MPTPVVHNPESDAAFAATIRARIDEIEADKNLDGETKARMLASRKAALADVESRLPKPTKQPK